MGRKTDAVALFEELSAAPYAHDFYQAMRRLECAFPERPRWGQARLPAEEAVRLGQDAALSFAASPLASFSPGSDSEPARLQVHLFGLLGPNGPLPLHLTEYVRERQRHSGDRTLGRFLDMLQHRFLAMFYRAWAQAQPHVNRDRPGEDRFTTFFGAFIGMSQPAFRNRDAVPDLAKLFHSGAFVRQVRNAASLGSVLQHYFRVPVRVVEFVGHWMALGEQEQTRLSTPGATLGAGAVLGGSVWDRQSKFRLELGPLTLEQYEAFLPGGSNLAALVAWVRMYTCLEWEWDARLLLKKNEVPPLALGRSGRLGWTSWLGTRPGTDAGDLCLNAEAFEARAGVRAA